MRARITHAADLARGQAEWQRFLCRRGFHLTLADPGDMLPICLHCTRYVKRPSDPS